MPDNLEEKLAELRRLQSASDAIRRDLGIGAPGAVIYQRWLSALDEEMVIVEANGSGGATIRVVKGDYPFDYLTVSEKAYETERDAQEEADRIEGGSVSLDAA